MIGGKVAVVCGYGDVGKGCAESLRGQGARVIITEIDPICALQAAMDGYQVKRLEKRSPIADIIITTTGNIDIVTVEHMQQDEAPGDRRQHRSLRQRDRHGRSRDRGRRQAQEVKPQVDQWIFPDGKKIIVLSEGRLLNLGNATGHPSFVMSNSFTNQVLAQIEIFTKPEEYPIGVYVLPKHLDEEVARLHLDALGVKLTDADPGAGGLPRRPGRGSLQVRPLPLLIGQRKSRVTQQEWGSAGGLLVVDDDAALAEMLTLVLRNEGFQSRIVGRGDEAKAAFRDVPARRGPAGPDAARQGRDRRLPARSGPSPACRS